MVRTRKKYVNVLPVKLILLLALTAVILLGYSTVLQAAEKDTKELGEITVFDPFMLTSISTNSTLGEDESGGGPWNPRALMMIPYRGPKRSPIKPPWPPE